MLQNATRRNIIAEQACIAPREQGPKQWSFRPQTLGSGYTASFFPAMDQGLNWHEQREPSKYQGGNQRAGLTGKEPAFYGEHSHPYDRYNDNSTNQTAMAIIANTQLKRWDGKNQIYAEKMQVPANPFTLYRNYVGSFNQRLSQAGR